MPLASCPRCKKMFNKTNNVLVCTSCETAEEDDYTRIREVLANQPGLTAEQTAKEADVAVAVVQRMVKEGALAAVNPSDAIMCGRCGSNPAISAAKRLCAACLEKLNLEVAQASAAIKMRDAKSAQVGEYLSARRAFDEKR